jgi:guanylate kinase
MTSPRPAKKGTLFVVSAPSGTGKTTLVKAVVPTVPDLVLSRSYTSRPARPGERDGIDYHFISRPQFESRRAGGEFLESAEVFGHLYGTSAVDTRRHLDAGRDLVLVIDVQGAEQVRRLESHTVGIFVLPPSPVVLEERLRGRSGSHLTEVELMRRLAVAHREVEQISGYDYIVVNDELEACVVQLQAIVVAERASMRAAHGEGARIAEAFRQLARPEAP